jgi:hypothetical protein
MAMNVLRKRVAPVVGSSSERVAIFNRFSRSQPPLNRIEELTTIPNFRLEEKLVDLTFWSQRARKMTPEIKRIGRE